MEFFRNYRFPIIVGLFLLAALSFFSFKAGREAVVQPAGRWIMEVIGPAQSGVDQAGDWIESWWRRYFSLVQAAEENQELKGKVASLRQEMMRLSGRIDAVITYWHYTARLEAKGLFMMDSDKLHWESV